jgi:hypothetical protein
MKSYQGWRIYEKRNVKFQGVGIQIEEACGVSRGGNSDRGNI